MAVIPSLTQEYEWVKLHQSISSLIVHTTGVILSSIQHVLHSLFLMISLQRVQYFLKVVTLQNSRQVRQRQSNSVICDAILKGWKRLVVSS